ncbi:Frigida-like [Dillenia turbinata]|uniref:FRIGIDA-like protein n=1 Tax=Dillenia turbinata TaxID=194707 RepID=A0AAN8UL48_9MAGN
MSVCIWMEVQCSVTKVNKGATWLRAVIDAPHSMFADILCIHSNCSFSSSYSSEIFKITAEWKDLQDLLESTQDSIQRQFKELSARTLQFAERERKVHEEMRDKVSNGLKKAFDPAKLVLDAMEGFYPPPPAKKGKIGLEATWKSCIFVLEQPMEISSALLNWQTSGREKLWEWKTSLQRC